VGVRGIEGSAFSETEGRPKMHVKRFLRHVPLLGLLIVLALAPVPTSCDGPECKARCDPVFDVAKVSDPWICPGNCPGGGVTHIDYSIEFRDDHSELCEPPENFSIKIRNVTDNMNEPGPSYTSPTPGVYSGSQEVHLTHDTEYELTVDGGTFCSGKISEKLSVQVVSGNTRYHDICYSGKLSWPTPFQGHQDFGPGVLIDHTHNLQDKFRIKVSNDAASRSETLMESGDGYALSGFPADGNWTVNLTTEQDVNPYNQQQHPQLCVRVYLRCDNCN
jgi:hypothetical protein